MNKDMYFKHITNLLLLITLFYFVSLRSFASTTDSTYYEKNPVYWFETSMYKLNKLRNPDVVMLGDSHIQSARWSELLGNYKVINRGIAGDNTEGMKSRLAEVIRLRPKIVIFEGGVNDVYNWVHPDLILRNIEFIVKTLKKNKIEVIVNSIILTGKNWGEAWIKQNHPEIDVVKYNFERNKVIKKINNLLKNYCKTNGVKFLDLNRFFEKKGFLNERFSRDNLHLNAKGYEIWARELKKYFKKIKIRDFNNGKI